MIYPIRLLQEKYSVHTLHSKEQGPHKLLLKKSKIFQEDGDRDYPLKEREYRSEDEDSSDEDVDMDMKLEQMILTDCYRCWHDSLIVSNLVYVIAGLCSFYVNQVMCALLQIAAAFASTAYHRHKERSFLPLDMCISGILGIVWLWSVKQVLDNGWHGFALPIALQIIACAFAFIYCGLPGGPHGRRGRRQSAGAAREPPALNKAQAT